MRKATIQAGSLATAPAGPRASSSAWNCSSAGSPSGTDETTAMRR
ncbi:MAG TPA: hypothetical protein VFS43_43345 [Polyangiaceae bacterium]|nr:hypothetical protein [Polyangiaceae bacterium]